MPSTNMARQRKEITPSFDPVLSRGILAIVLVIVATIITLSFFDKAGTVGVILDDYVLSFLFGSIRYASPAMIVIVAWFLVKDNEYNYRNTHIIGAVLFFVTLSSLLHLGFMPTEMWSQALLGHGGGVFGMVAWPLKMYLGSIATTVLLGGFLAVSVLLLFNTLILQFVMLYKKIRERLGRVGALMSEAFTIPGEEEDDTDTTTANLKTGRETMIDEMPDDDSEEERFTARLLRRRGEPVEEKEEENGEEDTEETSNTATTPVPGSWTHKVIIRDLPPLTLLSSKRGKPTSGDIEHNKEVIQEMLLHFGIEVDMGEIRVGPTVTQYTLKPRKGIKLSRITALSNDLALALAAHPIRIEAPIPGKSLVGIEVPNQRTALVTLRELLEDGEFQHRPHNLMLALGKDVAGKTWFADLPRMPHLLIAGATGSGKTVCVNTIILSLLYQNTAQTLRMIMVDPKRVELTLYNGIPHLLTPVITNTHKTVNALKWTIGEMERRFELLAQAGNRDIHSYNAAHRNDPLPHILFIIDELADLMATAAGEVEAGIIRLAQMARAVGIHLILATQRPSVDVITGLMKANIPARIAFSVASIVDSRTILDSPGAEKLLGRGDMLFQTAELSKPVRIQGAFISEQELKDVVEHLQGDEAPTYDDSIVEKQTGTGTLSMFGGATDGEDPLFAEAKQAVVGAGKASASFLQRKLKIGYARAARILDELEAAGVIGPGDGAKAREILVTATSESGTLDTGGKLNVYDESTPEEADEEMKDHDA